MYLSHYHFKIEPFSISSDPKFLWLGEKHKEALAALKYGILANKGFLLLTGDVGTGKTTLINALINNLGGQIRAATVNDPGLGKLDFLNFIAGAFKLKKNFKSKGEFISYFSLFLRLAHDKNKKVLLIIDEAQRLSDDLLEEIRLLSNIEKQHAKLINIFFVGQNEFNEILMKKENRALRQRITLIHTLEALNLKETHEYIRYRLQVAAARKNIFKPAAIEKIYSFSGGYPRLINIICDHALLTGFVKEKTVIDAQIIEECTDELRIPIKSYEKEDHGVPLRAAGENPKKIAEKGPSRFRIRKFFLLILLLLTAAVFYYQRQLGLSDVYLKKTRGRSMDAAVALKTESGFHPEQAAEPNNGTVVTYPISVPDRINLQETAALQAPSVFVPEKDLPNQTENIPSAEDGVQPPEATDIQPKKVLDPGQAVYLEQKINIYFGYNSFGLSDEALSDLDKIAAVMNQYQDLNILIKGYTDNSGKYGYNLKLSELRAAAVRNRLLKNGLNPLRMAAVGMGPEQAADNEGNEKPVQMNRRVEIEFTLAL